MYVYTYVHVQRYTHTHVHIHTIVIQLLKDKLKQCNLIHQLNCRNMTI